MIQGSINQLLQSAAIFGRLAPGYESKVEARQAKKQIAAVESQLAQTVPSEEGTVGANITQELLEEKAKYNEALFKAKPSQETYSQYVRSRAETGKEPLAVIKASPEEIAQERAEIEAETAQRLRQQELSKVRESLKANAPTVMGRRETNVKY